MQRLCALRSLAKGLQRNAHETVFIAQIAEAAGLLPPPVPSFLFVPACLRSLLQWSSGIIDLSRFPVRVRLFKEAHGDRPPRVVFCASPQPRRAEPPHLRMAARPPSSFARCSS